MSGRDADWRLQGQERYLEGALLVPKRYRARDESWDHDHCEFCSAKFVEDASPSATRGDPGTTEEVLTEGFTTTAEHPNGADYHWICPTCFGDFAARFGWRVVGS